VSVPAFGRTSQASSASFFSQALIPLAPAFLRYEAFSAAVQRKSTLSDALLLGGRGFRPLGFLVSMPCIMPTQNIS
jgi:hypothetical protein